MDIVQKFGEDVAVPENPEREGSPRLITIKQIAEEHGVSRSSVHTYRRNATFPQPVPVEGSTRIQYRADEVTAWFEANPPQQGKRTDLATQDEGAAMWSVEEPVPGIRISPKDRERLLEMIRQGAEHAAAAVGLADEDRERIGSASLEGVRGVLEEWRQQ
ncbi:helix-turn-helix transcriptional regulator [Streptomyces sp. NPDC058424]|uniref:helix-turn-helix transcriptional regulator n=1 Tax=Streptomyces sp. NPDC058424 TaxID=3346491 RepID=UPI00365E0D0B